MKVSPSILAVAGQKRSHFTHVTDIVPTVLDLIGIKPPTERHGVQLLPIDGRSMRAELAHLEAAAPQRTQYFETAGNRAIWKEGWKAVAFHRRGTDFDSDVWELYHVDEDFSESCDLAEREPDKLAELVDAWWAEARRNHVLPLDDRGFAERTNTRFRPHSPRDRSVFTYLPGMQHLGNGAAAPVAGRSFRLTSTIHRPTGTEEGVLLAHGSWNSGYAMMIIDNHLVYDFNCYGDHRILQSTEPVPMGASTVVVEFCKQPRSTAGTITMRIDDRPAGEMHLHHTFEHFVAFQGLDVGADRLSPVRDQGRGEYPFTGSFDSVVIELLEPARARAHEPFD